MYMSIFHACMYACMHVRMYACACIYIAVVCRDGSISLVCVHVHIRDEDTESKLWLELELELEPDCASVTNGIEWGACT